MRVLFLPAAILSHFFPMVPLAWAARSAGDEVLVAGLPPLLASVTAAGLSGVPVGGPYDLLGAVAGAAEQVRRETGEGPSATGDLSGMSPEARKLYVERRVAPHAVAAGLMAPDLVELIQAQPPDLVVSDPITMVAPLVAELAGVPLVHHLWGPQPASLRKFPGYGLAPESWPAELKELYGRHGVEPRVHHGVATVDPGPPSLQPAEVPGKLNGRYMCYNGPSAAPEWLRRPAERPRILLSWLTVDTVRDGQGPLPALVSALAELDAEIVVAVRQADLERLPSLPDNVRLAPDLPLSTVMPTVRVAVNHGGTGTVLTAACHGVPQVIVPGNPGLAFNAECLAGSGAAVALDPEGLDPAEVAAAAAALLRDDAPERKAAQALRAENAEQPPPAQLHQTLRELA
uniref:PyrC11 n=1 Tax=Streptomyces rugosporus TaxID=295838 RepID=K7QSJ5_STRRG|nr:PyrC11 [Streptomyces rugosporus]